MDQNRHQQKTVKDWSNPNVARWLVRKLSWVLAILVAFEFWGLATGKIHHHEHFESISAISGLDAYPGFFAFYGFLAFSLMLWIAKKFVGHVLTRRDDYYQSTDKSADSVEHFTD